MKRPTRKQLLLWLSPALALLSILTNSWNTLVANVSLGIAIGLAVSHLRVKPPAKIQPFPQVTTMSAMKTFAFWAHYSRRAFWFFI
jgi:hypothetical protein